MKFLKFKTKKNKILFFLIFGITFISAIVLFLLSHIDYVLVENPVYEVNTENTLFTLFSQVNVGNIKDQDTLLDTKNVGEKAQDITIINQLGIETTINVPYSVVDTTPPDIAGETELSFAVDDDIDILSHFTAEDNSLQKVSLKIDGDYDLTRAGEYTINIIAKDESNNESIKEVTLKITEPIRPTMASSSTSIGATYYIEVNRRQNVVIVYSRGQNGNYSNIAKVFVASTGAPGSETPLGTYTTSDKYESLYLVGNVWGHYAVRINGPYFFHSVPYFTKGAPWNNLEYLEYNKLGQGASAGCVRLAAADAKWIYDNIGYGTTVKIYDSDSLPPGIIKPTAIKINENSQNRGWDPTDPDPNNPWL